MKKTTKIIGLSLAAAILLSASVALAAPKDDLANILNGIKSFFWGKGPEQKKLDSEKTQCVKSALSAYRATLKDGQDQFLAASKNLRGDYRAAVGGAISDFNNTNSADKELKKEKADELKSARGASLKEWSDKIRLAREAWMKNRVDANEVFRSARQKCLDQKDYNVQMRLAPANSNANN